MSAGCPPLHQSNQPIGTLLGPWPSGPTCETEVCDEQAEVCSIQSVGGSGHSLPRLTERKQACNTKTNPHRTIQKARPEKKNCALQIKTIFHLLSWFANLYLFTLILLCTTATSSGAVSQSIYTTVFATFFSSFCLWLPSPCCSNSLFGVLEKTWGAAGVRVGLGGFWRGSATASDSAWVWDQMH